MVSALINKYINFFWVFANGVGSLLIISHYQLDMAQARQSRLIHHNFSLFFLGNQTSQIPIEIK